MHPTSANHPANQILVAGIGNIFLGDDGFGSELARHLLSLDWTDEVRVVDYGIRGIDLAYALLDGYAAVILVDAIAGDQPPGTLRVIEPEIEGSNPASTDTTLLDAHSLHPLKVLQMVRAMGGELQRIRIVGCQPGDLGGEQGRIGLTPPVQAAMADAEKLVLKLVNAILAERRKPSGDHCGEQNLVPHRLSDGNVPSVLQMAVGRR